ncbi:MAG: UbiD family decarboxylase [Intestinibacter sp.]|uniref:UbiD family decarboxylase n=1 Tax=Intestinibacter sp. TaxID=1965304 RepID=UPI002A800AA8|nr:UbiD family decarboxylase [Intestinibacter sp.]MDY4576118.1 UbiD family decarboxylase [Intestinibacter sp.]
MDLKKFLDTIRDQLDTLKYQIEDKIDKIKSSKKYFVSLSLSFLAFLVLLVVIFFSRGDLNVGKQADILVDSISNRKYTEAYQYYTNLEKEFSASKMNKFNKVASKKLSVLVVNSGDKYISGEISKEQYSGLINTINALNEITIDVDQLLDISSRVEQMYIDENINYEKASSYMEITTSLNGIYQDLDEYKNKIKTVYESRKVYEEGSKFQQIKKYKEAIEKYDKVIEDDKKYYSLAQSKRQECIDSMYNYYISQANISSKEGKYEDALVYLTYLKPYYPNDEEIEKLEDEYKEKISVYTLSSDDIKNLISKKSGIDADLLSVISYQQTIGQKIYYYAEVVKDNKIINEVLVEAKSKQIYSYKSEKVDYDCEYSDGYYKVDEDGNYVFAISSKDAATIVKDKLSQKKEDYNDLEVKFKSEIVKYVDEEELNKLIEKNNNIYYYVLVKKGWFSFTKEVYLVNMYDKTVYKFVDSKISKI